MSPSAARRFFSCAGSLSSFTMDCSAAALALGSLGRSSYVQKASTSLALTSSPKAVLRAIS